LTVKETAKKVIDNLPNEVTIDDIVHALYIKIKFDNGEREIQQGKGISHEEVKQRLQKWVK
jgi:hypothetical protein